MSKDDDILIRIDGKTYRIREDKPALLKRIPWSQRKRLLSLLEAVKKAEYIDREGPKATPEKPAVKQTISLIKRRANQSNQVNKNSNTVLDSDALMQRFLAEQKQHKNTIPGKADVYKWFLIIFTFILLLVLIF